MIISVLDRVENIVGKGENAGYHHFLLFPQCFQKASFPDGSKGVIVWEWATQALQICPSWTVADRKFCLVKTMTFVLEKVKNIVEKSDNVGY